MLAARAAADPRLKELMKVVATSKASPEQLKEFQGHIDEFNALVKRQEAERAEKEKDNGKGKEQQPSEGTASSATPQTREGSEVRPPPPVSASPAPTVSRPATYNAVLPQVGTPSGAPSPYASYPPPPPQPPPARAEPIIKHIVIEFHGEGASQDRWLFPEYAALDIKYGGLEMTCSFFVERKGSEVISTLAGGSADETAALQSKWKADQEYYQAVTILVRANQHRTIETVARAARTLPEVQEQMKRVMKNKIRAPEEYLVHQLPREKVLATADVLAGGFVDSAVEMLSEDEDDELEDFYGNW
jgi:hypothetical protein